MLFVPSLSFSANLMEVYELAINSDPELKRAQAVRLESLEAGPQSRARFLPSLFLSANSASSNDEVTRPDVPSTSDSFSTSGYNLNLTLPLFYYDSFVQSGQADYVIAQAEVDLTAAHQDLMIRVADKYFEVLAAQDNLTFSRAEKKAIDRQLEQTKQRFNVGLIAITDVHEAQSRFDLSIANEINAENRVANAHEAMREVTGKYFKQFTELTKDTPLLEPNPSDIEQWGNTALEQNLQLTSAKFAVEIARSRVKIQKSPHYPTLDLVGNHNFSDRLESNFFPRETTSTSITLQFNWNLYEGGATSSRVSEARHQLEQVVQNLEKQRRATVRGARDAYLGVLAGISRVKALKQAVVSQQSALDATQAGFEVGTRTTVDVLNARTLLYASQRNYAQSRYNYILNTFRLKLAAGTLSTTDLKLVNDWLH